MNLMATLSAPLLDPPTLPQAAFAQVDEALNYATQLRAEAELLKAHAKQNEEDAKNFDEYAATLQVNAEEDREYVQAELDNTLEYHGDVLKHFLLVPDNKEELEKLTNNVEEGRAYMHEVIGLGEKLLHFRAANLGSSQQIKHNLSFNLSTSGSTAVSSFRIPFLSDESRSSLFATVTGQSAWRDRINSVLGNRLSGVNRPADLSFSQVLTDRTASNEGDKNDVAVSTEVRPDAVAPLPNVTMVLGVEAKGQPSRREKKENGAVEDTVLPVQGGAQIHEEDYITLESPPVNETPTQLKETTPDPNLTIPEAQRRKKSDPTEGEEAVVFNEPKTLARYRELLKNDGGMIKNCKGRAKKKVKAEMQQQIRSNDRIPQEKKEMLIDYGHKQISAMLQRENALIFSNPPGSDKQLPNKLKRKGFESALQPAFKKRRQVQGPTEIEKAAWLNETDMLAKYRNAYAKSEVNDWDKRAEARMVISKELNGMIRRDDRISGPRKAKFVLFVNNMINAMESKEIKIAAQRNQDGAQLADMPDQSAGDMMADEETEGGYTGRLAGLHIGYLSEESVDDSQYP